MCKTPPSVPCRMLRWFCMVSLFGAVLCVAPEVWAQATGSGGDAGGEGKSLWRTLGRMHVVVLHMPIGLLMGAVVLEAVGYFRGSKGFDLASLWTIGLGTAAALVTVVFGLLLENHDGTGTLTEQWHKWLGIGVAVLAAVALVTKYIAVRRQGQDRAGGMPLSVARVSLLSVAGVLPIVGHLGGNMTHGNTYLFEHSPVQPPAFVVHFPNKPPVVASVAESGSLEARWLREVQPILDAHCIKCHSASRTEADLRLDLLEYALREREDYHPAIVPGSPAQSELYRVISLPPQAEAFMPPKKPEALSLDDIRTVGAWLIDAENLGKEPVSIPDGDGVSGEAAGPAYDTQALGLLNQRGGVARAQAAGSDKLEVRFPSDPTPVGDEAIAALNTLAKYIASLDFAGSGVTDADLGRLGRMSLLEQLSLKDTAISDAGLESLSNKINLLVLDLSGTQVSDAGLDTLEALALDIFFEKIDLTGSQATAEGVARLREALGPEVEVVFGE